MPSDFEAWVARVEAASALAIPEKPPTLLSRAKARVKFYFDKALNKFRRPAAAPNAIGQVRMPTQEDHGKDKKRKRDDENENEKKKGRSEDDGDSPRPIKMARPTLAPRRNGMVDRATLKAAGRKTTKDVGVQTVPITEPLTAQKSGRAAAPAAPRNDSAIDLTRSDAVSTAPFSSTRDPYTAELAPREIRNLERSVKRAEYSEAVAAAKAKQRSSAITAVAAAMDKQQPSSSTTTTTTTVASAKNKQRSVTTSTAAKFHAAGAIKTKSGAKAPARAASRFVLAPKTKVAEDDTVLFWYYMNDGATVTLPKGCNHIGFNGQRPVVERTAGANTFEVLDFLRETKAIIAIPPKDYLAVAKTDDKPEAAPDTSSPSIPSTAAVAVKEASPSQETECEGITSTQEWEARKCDVETEKSNLLAVLTQKQAPATPAPVSEVVETPANEPKIQTLEPTPVETPKQVAIVPALLPPPLQIPAEEPKAQEPIVQQVDDQMDGIEYAPTVVVSLIAKDLPVEVPAQLPPQIPMQMPPPMALPAPIAPTLPFPHEQNQKPFSSSLHAGGFGTTTAPITGAPEIPPSGSHNPFQAGGFGSQIAPVSTTAAPTNIETSNPFLTGMFASTTAPKNAPLGLGNSMLKPKVIPEDMEVDDSWEKRQQEQEAFTGYRHSGGEQTICVAESGVNVDQALDELIEETISDQIGHNGQNRRDRENAQDGRDGRGTQNRNRWDMGLRADAGYEVDADTGNRRDRDRRDPRIETGLSTPRGNPTTGYCHAFARNGRCRFGNHCRYSHQDQNAVSRSQVVVRTHQPAISWTAGSSTRAPNWGSGVNSVPVGRGRGIPLVESDSDDEVAVSPETLRRWFGPQQATSRPRAPSPRPEAPVFRRPTLFQPRSPYPRPEAPMFRPPTLFQPQFPLFVPEKPEDLPDYESDEEPRGRAYKGANNTSLSPRRAVVATTDSYRPTYRPSWQHETRPRSGSMTEEDTDTEASRRQARYPSPVRVDPRKDPRVFRSALSASEAPAPGPRPTAVRFGEEETTSRPAPRVNAFLACNLSDSDIDADDEL